MLLMSTQLRCTRPHTVSPLSLHCLANPESRAIHLIPLIPPIFPHLPPYPPSSPSSPTFQDVAFNDGSHRRVTIPTVPWFKERILTNVPLGSLLLTILLRIVQFNVTKMEDAYV